jgi:hypothetical protein
MVAFFKSGRVVTSPDGTSVCVAAGGSVGFSVAAGWVGGAWVATGVPPPHAARMIVKISPNKNKGTMNFPRIILSSGLMNYLNKYDKGISLLESKFTIKLLFV